MQETGVDINVKDDMDKVIRIWKYDRERKRSILIKLTKGATRTIVLKNTK